MSDPVADPFGLVGTRLDSKYEIEAVVAEGGFGVVYRGLHRALKKPVAIKILKVPADFEGATRKEFLAKFEREAQTIAALDHPAIVRVLDFGASPMPIGAAAPWAVLDWIEGRTLEADLAARQGAGGRPPKDCLALLRPVLEALAHAHGEGIVHRDLKPANLMLAATKRGEVSLKVLDFGIAKLMGDEEGTPTSGRTATQTRLHAFSVHYAAPEQIAGTRTGPWTDVHALGLLLTEVLTDSPPYDGTDTAEIYAEILAARRPTPAKRGLDVGAWEAVLARATALRPGDRYPDARALLDALAADVPAAVHGTAAPVATLRDVAEAPTVPRVTTLRPAEVTRSRAVAGRRGRVLAVGMALALAVAAIAGLRLGVHPAPSARDAAVPLAFPRAPQAAPAEPPTTVGTGRPTLPVTIDAGAAATALRPGAVATPPRTARPASPVHRPGSARPAAQPVLPSLAPPPAAVAVPPRPAGAGDTIPAE